MQSPCATLHRYIFASCFMCFFSVVIAFFKDIPDVKGDRLAAIQTLSVRNGVRMA